MKLNWFQRLVSKSKVEHTKEHNLREWLSFPTLHFNKTRLTLQWETHIVKADWIKTIANEHLVNVSNVGFEFNPKKWKIGQDHTFYDSPHCMFDFGPLNYYTSDNWHCKECVKNI